MGNFTAKKDNHRARVCTNSSLLVSFEFVHEKRVIGGENHLTHKTCSIILGCVLTYGWWNVTIKLIAANISQYCVLVFVTIQAEKRYKSANFINSEWCLN